jgi:hypothetical protein
MKTILSLALIVALATACSPKTPNAKAKSSARRGQPTTAATLVNENPNQRVAWNWDSYPAVKKMRLGVLPCQLQPRSQIAINSTVAGALKLYVGVPQTNLPAGLVFGEFEPTIFELEAKALDEARVKLDEREKLQREIELPRLQLKLKRELKEMEYRVDLIRYYSTNLEMAQMALGIGGGSKSPVRPESLKEAEEELRLANQNYTYLQETNSAVVGTDIGSVRLQWERQKVEFERRRAQATLKMPFNGQLTLTLPLADGVAEYPVNIGQEIGVVRDLSTVRLRVPFANAAWSAISPERLIAIVRLPGGQELEAQFAYNKVERAQNREESAYYFQFLPEHTAMVARLIGSDVTCEVWMNLGQVTRVVPKLALIMHNPTAFQHGNWSLGLATAFPGARLAVEGQTDLGIVLPPKPVVASAR